MFTLRFENSSKTVSVCCPHYEIFTYPNNDKLIGVVIYPERFTGDGVERLIAKPDSLGDSPREAFNVCYVTNIAGVTIDTIRAR
jgi:hypothetical protein